MTLEEVWVVHGEKNQDDRWVEAVFTTEADAEACATWMNANPPLDGRSESVHAPRYSFEAQGYDLRSSFSPDDPYGHSL